MVAQHSWCFVSVLRVSSKARARPRRWGRMEGKDYVMEDGDVVEFCFNVRSFLNEAVAGSRVGVAQLCCWSEGA